MLYCTTMYCENIWSWPSRQIECHFHYLDIQAVESKRPSHFCIVTNDRPYNFATTGDAGNFSSNADVILTDLASAIKQIFPTVPLKYIIRKDTDGIVIRPGRGSILPKLGLESPTVRIRCAPYLEKLYKV
uniref:Carm_PH domain-containing protein n=1 Tax=Glossina brevipalpis TaxID=37001 RepID=A0A1A9WI48_9MUSC